MIEQAAPRKTRTGRDDVTDDGCPDCTALKERVVHLERALATSHPIGQAVGILMATANLTAEEAFDVLVTTSLTHNVNIRKAAIDVVARRSDSVVQDPLEGPENS